MPLIVPVRFRFTIKPYYFGCQDLPDLSVGDYVIVETSRGVEAGRVSGPPKEIPPKDVIGELKPVVRRASAREIYEMHRLHLREPVVLERCRELVTEHKLPMKILRAGYNYDGSRLLFHFSAESRVDFRGLVRTLARTFKTRIDLHQVGVRDEAKLVGTLGACGRLLCCRDWLPEFSKVSIRMAKQQDLSLNPAEISGVCGRLLCCLAYEDRYYMEAKQELPKRGEPIQTPHGSGIVSDVNVITKAISVQLDDGRVVQVPASEADSGSSLSPEEERSRRRRRR